MTENSIDISERSSIEKVDKEAIVNSITVQQTKPKYTRKQQILIMLPLLIGGFIALLNETILSVAFPHLMSSLGVSLVTVQWLGTAMGVGMMVVVAGQGVGPVLSGIILQHLHWHWLFIIILPIAIIAMVLGAFFLKSYATLTKPKIDGLSIILSTIGFGGIIFGLTSIETLGLHTLIVPISLISGIFSLYLFSKRQLRMQQPMLQLRVFRYPMFTLGTIILFIVFLIPFAINIILPTYMQNALDIKVSTAGMALLPGSILMIFAVPLSGYLFDKIGAKPLVIMGFIALIISMFFFSNILVSTGLTTLIGFHILMSLGIAMLITPAQTNSLNQLPKPEMAHGVAILNTTQQIAAAFGSSLFIGLMGAVYNNHLAGIKNPDITQQHMATTEGATTAFTATLIIVFIGFLMSLFLKRR